VKLSEFEVAVPNAGPETFLRKQIGLAIRAMSGDEDPVLAAEVAYPARQADDPKLRIAVWAATTDGLIYVSASSETLSIDGSRIERRASSWSSAISSISLEGPDQPIPPEALVLRIGDRRVQPGSFPPDDTALIAFYRETQRLGSSGG